MKDRQDVRQCFVIMPFHEKDDPKRLDRIDFDRVYREIIRPAVEGDRLGNWRSCSSTVK